MLGSLVMSAILWINESLIQKVLLFSSLGHYAFIIAALILPAQDGGGVALAMVYSVVYTLICAFLFPGLLWACKAVSHGGKQSFTGLVQDFRLQARGRDNSFPFYPVFASFLAAFLALSFLPPFTPFVLKFEIIRRTV